MNRQWIITHALALSLGLAAGTSGVVVADAYGQTFKRRFVVSGKAAAANSTVTSLRNTFEGLICPRLENTHGLPQANCAFEQDSQTCIIWGDPTEWSHVQLETGTWTQTP